MNPQQLQEKLNRHLGFLEQDENNLALLIEITDLYQQMNDLESAQTYLDRAKSINPEACLAHQGMLYLNQDQLTLAKESFYEALTHEDTAALRYNLSLCHFICGEFEEARNLLSSILEEEPHPDAQLLMARILHQQSNIDEAMHLTKNILKHHPDDADASGLLSLLYFDLNEEVLAKQTALQALEINPDNYDAQLVSILTRLMTNETSIEEIEALLKKNPQDSRLWFALGSTCMSQGQFPEAESALHQAISIYPEFYDCQIILGWCQLLQNHIDTAEESYQKAANLMEEFADAWGGLALVSALKEDFSKAEQLIFKANELNPECFVTEIAETIYFNHKNPEQAKKHLVNALNNSKIPVSERLALVIEELESSEKLY